MAPLSSPVNSSSCACASPARSKTLRPLAIVQGISAKPTISGSS